MQLVWERKDKKTKKIGITRKRERERERKKEREQRAGETQQAKLENPRLDKESGRLKIKKGRRIVGCNKTNDCLE